MSHVADDTDYHRRFQAIAQSDFAPDEPLAASSARRCREKASPDVGRAGKARMGAAARARWAKIKGTKASPTKKRRKMSAESRARISAAAKARWKKAKAAGKNTL